MSNTTTNENDQATDLKEYQRKYDEAKKFLESVCKCKEECSNCGKHLTKPQEIELKLKADYGDMNAQFDLAKIFRYNKCYCYEEQACIHYLMAGKQGHTEAQFKVGLIFLHGPDGDVPGLKTDKNTARDWFVQSAINGSSDARFILRFDYNVCQIDYEIRNKNTGNITKHTLDCRPN